MSSSCLLGGYGLIVVGYSGSDPKNMENVFGRIDRSTSANGISWCLPKGTAPGARLERLLQRHPDAIWLVEIESFDSLMNQIEVATSSRLALSDSSLLMRSATLNKVFLEITNAFAAPSRFLGRPFWRHVINDLALANGFDSGAIRFPAIERSAGSPFASQQCRLLEKYIGERAKTGPCWESIPPGSSHSLRTVVPKDMSFCYFATVQGNRLAWIAFAGQPEE